MSDPKTLDYTKGFKVGDELTIDGWNEGWRSAEDWGRPQRWLVTAVDATVVQIQMIGGHRKNEIRVEMTR